MFVKEKAIGEVTVKEPSTMARVFLNAANEMEQRGMCKWCMFDETGRICTAQSLLLGGGNFCEACYIFFRFVGENVCSWNNEPKRQTSDVVAMLRRIAATV